jgi:NADPH2:quinone reductase
VRARQLHDFDGPDGLELVDVAEPDPLRGSVLVDVYAIGVNFPDLLATKGLYRSRARV